MIRGCTVSMRKFTGSNILSLAANSSLECNVSQTWRNQNELQRIVNASNKEKDIVNGKMTTIAQQTILVIGTQKYIVLC